MNELLHKEPQRRRRDTPRIINFAELGDSLRTLAKQLIK